MKKLNVMSDVAPNGVLVPANAGSCKMLTMFKFLLILAIPLVVFSCGNRNNRTGTSDSTAVTPATSETMGSTNNKDNDNMDFLKEAAYGGLMEVELGKYAQQNAHNKRVKNFGAMMVRDHSKVNDELKSIAQKKNFDIPTTMDDKHLKMVNDLQQKRGSDFDKDYMKEMVNDHEKDVDKFKKFAENNNDKIDPDLKSFASKTLPVLLMHEDSAKNIRDVVK